MGSQLAACFRGGAGTGRDMVSMPINKASGEINKNGHREEFAVNSDAEDNQGEETV